MAGPRPAPPAWSAERESSASASFPERLSRSDIMVLDLGPTALQMLSPRDGVATSVRSHGDRPAETLDRAQIVPPDKAAFYTAPVGRRSYISPRTGPVELLGSLPSPEVPADWTALAVDGSHMDVDSPPAFALPPYQPGRLRPHLRPQLRSPVVQRIRLGHGGRRSLSAPGRCTDETLITGPLLGALRTVREVKRLADGIESQPDARPILALLEATLALWNLQRGQSPTA